MRILLADTAGFCMGVKRAVNLALDLAGKREENIYTIGPLIHNPQTVEMLAKKGVKVVNAIEDVDCGTIIIRAHGITPEHKGQIMDSGREYFDATCPLVLRIHSTIGRYAGKGYTTVIVGDKGHAEVAGLMGYADGRGVVVEEEADLEQVPHDMLCVVAQSTQNRSFFEKIVEKLKARGSDIKVFDTICDATTERQEEVRMLAGKAAAMVIVGGRNSANTRRLVEISRSLNVKTFHVENEEELDEKELARCENVGVTAGASTPNWVIEKVIDRLGSIGRVRRNALPAMLSKVGSALVKSDLFIGMGAGLLCFSTILLHGTGELPMQPMVLSAAVSACYVFAMHILNHYTDPEHAQYKESYKLAFLDWHKKLLITLGAISIISAAVMSALLGLAPLIVLLFASISGLIYNFRVVPGPMARMLRFSRIRDIPASKNLLMALAWCVVTMLIPVFEMGKTFSTETLRQMLIVFMFTFTLVFTRSTLLDIRDIQGDQMVGNETLPILLGKERTKIIMLGLLLVCSVSLVLASLAGWVSSLGYYLLIPLGYCFVYLYLYHKRRITTGISTEIAADVSFYVSGAVALVYYVICH